MAEKREMRRGLGRGLSALMSDVDVRPAVVPEEEASPRQPDRMIPIEKLFPNKDQPRRTFTPDQLNELSESIRAKGIIQPIIVRNGAGSDGHCDRYAEQHQQDEPADHDESKGHSTAPCSTESVCLGKPGRAPEAIEMKSSTKCARTSPAETKSGIERT